MAGASRKAGFAGLARTSHIRQYIRLVESDETEKEKKASAEIQRKDKGDRTYSICASSERARMEGLMGRRAEGEGGRDDQSAGFSLRRPVQQTASEIMRRRSLCGPGLETSLLPLHTAQAVHSLENSQQTSQRSSASHV
ncbi:hypothetical protein AOLI_G00176460 [Acnodon oligacanthus]